MISVDTETTGVDLRHGALPFFVTMCREDGEQLWWEWSVDPLTRQVDIPSCDVEEIRQEIEAADELALQNVKFDALAFRSSKIIPVWPWSKTRCTLIAGHLLHSGMPHDLTSMVIHYLGVNIEPFEQALQEATVEARRIVRTKDFVEEFGEWKLAKKGLEEMPSAKEKTWKFDTWLPKAVARRLGYKADHPWYTVLQEYANADSASTLPLAKRLINEIKAKDLWEIYLTRMEALPAAYAMESHGVTMSKARLEELRKEFREESERKARVCVNIADSLGKELTLPKSGNNKSLLDFCFGEDGLNLPVVVETDKGNPSLDKTAMEEYLAILPPRSKGRTFIKALRRKRKRDTSNMYLDAYERFWVPIGISNSKGEQLWFRLYPGFNPTGTGTLRWSSSNPNAQNISKQETECEECQGEGCSACNGTGKDAYSLRYCFGPAPGREWWSFDYENIELRIPAYESGERAMIELFEKPDEPPYFGSYHLMNASIVYPDEFWPLADKKGAFKKKYPDTLYQYIKNFGFAVSYGAVPESGTADRAAHKAGAQLMVMDKLQEHTKLNRKWIDYANRYGYVETLPDKNVNPRRGYPVMCSRTDRGRISPTVPLNYHVQSTAMWCTMKAMIRCQDQLNEWNQKDPRGYYMVLQVHDELVFDFPKGGINNLPKARKIRRLMEESGEDIGIPLRVSMAYNPVTWAKDEKLVA